MWSELIMENQENVLRELDTLLGNLAQYRQAIADGDQARLQELLNDGKLRKEQIDG
jgi:prephenate dehydrogenase